MLYRNLGSAGVKVSRLCLGTAFRSHLFKQGVDESIEIATIHRALELGVNFIDTANFYSHGRSEEVVGRAIHGLRDEVVLATKVRSPIKPNPGPNDIGLSRYHILREVERSLTRLQTDHIDVYWLHAPDDSTPIDETLRAMDDLIHAGKVRYVGCSNLPAWQVCEALWRSDVLRLNAFVAIQNQYNLLNRFELEPELMPLCRKHGLGIVTYSPLAIGLLSGAFRHGQPPPPGTPWADEPRYREAFTCLMTPRADEIVQALIEIAAGHGCTPAQAAMAWLLAQDAVSSVIIGPDTPAHVDEVVQALNVTLTSADLARLDALSQPVPPFRIA